MGKRIGIRWQKIAQSCFRDVKEPLSTTKQVKISRNHSSSNESSISQFTNDSINGKLCSYIRYLYYYGIIYIYTYLEYCHLYYNITCKYLCDYILYIYNS